MTELQLPYPTEAPITIVTNILQTNSSFKSLTITQFVKVSIYELELNINMATMRIEKSRSSDTSLKRTAYNYPY